MKNILIASLLVFSCQAWSADTEPAQPAAKSVSSILQPARNAIKAGNYEKAVDLLTEADLKKSADWNNLMGYSLRKKDHASGSPVSHNGHCFWPLRT